MIQWFTRKKNGAISIMLAIILIPMLAFGSVLMEAARIHSARAILSEIVDNGLYSMLAFYDPDLLSRFGLLAMDPDVSIDEMDKYMMETANEYLQNPKNIEKLLSIQESGIEAEKLFALNDIDVLERQIMEYTKYRGPVDLAASALDLDKIIKELETTIQNALPILNQMQAAARAIESTVNTIYSVVDYSEKAGKFKGLIDTYNTAYEEYYSGLDGLITFMQENDPEDSKPEPPEKPDHMTDDEKEAYKEDLEAYKEAKKEYEESVKEYKKELKEYKETFADAKTSYLQAIKGLKDGMGDYKTAHEAVKTALSSYKNILPDYNQQMDKYSINKTTLTKEEKKQFNEISSAIQDTHRKYEGAWDYLSQHFAAENTDLYTGYERDLEDEYSRVNKTTADSITKESSADSLAAVYHVDPIKMLCPMDIISQVINMIESFFSELVESFAILIKILKIVAFFAGGPSTFDMQYIVNIESGAAGQLPSRTGMSGSESPHMEGDLNTVRDELDKTREVADQIGYDLNEMPVSENYDNGNSQLEREMNNISYRLQSLLESCNKLMNPSIFDLLSMGLSQLATIISIIVDVVSMLGSLLAVAIMFQGELTKYIMRGVLLNTYIVGKFSDRTNVGSFAKYSSYRAPSETVTGLDETIGWLKRDVIEFKNYFGYGKKDIAFSGAEAEYVLCGDMSEVQNQTAAFQQILFIRLLSNCVPVALDETAHGVMEASGPFFPIVYLVWLAAECLVDMQLLTLMNDGVPLIKSSIYLSMDGIDKLLEKIGSYDTMSSRDDAVRNVVQEISDTAKAGMNGMKDPAAWGNAGSGSSGGSGGGSGGGSSGKVDLSKPDESGKVDLSKDKSALDSISGFLGDWKYSQYIWLLLCFRPNEIKLERTADLIQMEMSKKRQVSGDIGPFLMKDAYTYVRVDVRAQTVPLLPIPTVPGANGHGLNLEKVYYGGY